MAELDQRHESTQRQGEAAMVPVGRSIVLGLVAGVLALSVYLLNGAPLFYFDSAGYLSQGHSMIEAAGLTSPVVEIPADQGREASDELEPDLTVDASRSAVYALSLSLLDVLGVLDAAVFLNLAMIWLSVLLVARRLSTALPDRAASRAALAMIAASFGALPFYVAFLMPDILAPVMILMLSLIFAYLPDLRRTEFLLAMGLALAAVLSHPSHLLMAAVFVPVGLLASPAMKGRRLWVSLGLALMLIGAGATERVLFSAAVERFEDKEARYLPFLTVRLIADGPGLDFLRSACPDPERATCRLLDELEKGEDSRRYLAPNILFSEVPELGTYKFLTETERTEISREQVAFMVDVLRSDPFAVAAAVARNTAAQLSFNRVDMTIPPPGQLAALDAEHGQAVAHLRNGRLVTNDRSWLDPLGMLHAALYVMSGLVILALLFSPRSLPDGSRAFAILVLAGILANALVCGGVSEPAHRYGARVMFLLPILAALLASVSVSPVRKP